MYICLNDTESVLQACMLTFYPEFEAEGDDDLDLILLLDLSNSMKGASLTQAKKVVLLILHLLPQQCRFNVIVFGTCKLSLTYKLAGCNIVITFKVISLYMDYLSMLISQHILFWIYVYSQLWHVVDRWHWSLSCQSKLFWVHTRFCNILVILEVNFLVWTSQLNFWFKEYVCVIWN